MGSYSSKSSTIDESLSSYNLHFLRLGSGPSPRLIFNLLNLREGQVLLLLESSQEGPERWVGISNQRLESTVPTFNKTSQNGVVLVPHILVEDWLSGRRADPGPFEVRPKLTHLLREMNNLTFLTSEIKQHVCEVILIEGHIPFPALRNDNKAPFSMMRLNGSRPFQSCITGSHTQHEKRTWSNT